MSDDGLLGRAELEQAFAALGDRLVRRGVVADLFVVGGAAMALAYDAKRVTRDVDATFVPHGVVLEEARNVADALGLPPWWLKTNPRLDCTTATRPSRRRPVDLARDHRAHPATPRPAPDRRPTPTLGTTR